MSEKNKVSIFVDFQKDLEKKNSPEEKIRFALEFMKQALSQKDSPQFKLFWDAKNLMIPFFKDNMHPLIRSTLWKEFIDLSDEAKQLRVLLNEQSAFASEQIALAIEALEADFAQVEDLSSRIVLEDFPKINMAKDKEKLRDLQKKQALLALLAKRIQGLKAELLQTDMRMKEKNVFFQRLSALADQVFPARKRYVDQISEEFVELVKQFVETHCQEQKGFSQPFYAIKEEIKKWQALAKILSLHAEGFTQSREMLSQAWDIIRSQDLKRKEQMQEKRKVSKEVVEKVEGFLNALKELCQKTDASQEEIDKLAKKTLEEVQKASLLPADEKALRKEIASLQHQHFSNKEEQRKQKHLEKMQQWQELKKNLLSAFLEEKDVSMGDLQEKMQHLQEICSSLDYDFIEQVRQGLVLRKTWKELVGNAQNPALQILEKLDALKKQAKASIETYRTWTASSSLGIEMSMHMQDVLKKEKSFLEEMETHIDELLDQMES